MTDRGWKFYPALKLALPFAAGIIIARTFAPPLEAVLIVLAGALFWLCAGIFRERWGVMTQALLVALVSGALAFTLSAEGATDGLEGMALRDAELIGRVAGEGAFRKGRIEFVVECDSLLYRNSVAHPATGVLVRLYDTSAFDPESLPGQGDRVMIAGRIDVPSGPVNPGAFDYGAYLRSRGIGLVMSIPRASAIHIYRRDDLDPLERLVLPVRRAARRFCDRHAGGEEGDILRALLLGERDGIDPETREAFTYTGTVHVLAVSGFNVGLIALALFVVVSWIGNRWGQLLLFVPVLVLYTVVAGGESSIGRATIMAAAFMLARASGRIARPLNTLGFAALAILVVAPGELFDIGFQLSFASVAGIILLYVPAWEWIVEHLPLVDRYAPGRWLAGMFLLTFCAQLFTLPLVLHHFGFVSFISLLVNLPVVPLTSVALGAGGAGTLAALVSEPVASWFGGSAFVALAIALECVRWGGELPGGASETGAIGIAGVAVLAAVVLRLAFSRSHRQVVCRGIALALATITMFLFERINDPLRQSGSYLCLLKGRDGIVAATVANDTVRLYAAGRSADSIALHHTGEALRRRFGAEGIITVPMDSIDRLEKGRELLLLERRPLECIPPELPVLFSYTGRRPLGIVRLWGERFLQVPLRMDLDEAIVLRYRNGWREVEWR